MVVDVLRAFTTTAYAFDRGAKEIVLVSTTEEAFELRDRESDYLLIGEVNGLPIDGFNLPNSPSAIENLDLSNRRLVLRTTAGTQGVVLATQASQLLVSSLCVATATANYISRLNPEVVTFVETGVRPKGGGEEDAACADYIASLLLKSPISVQNVRNRVRESRAAAKFKNTESIDFPAADLQQALKIDCFQFAMTIERSDNLLILRSTHE
ncbi:MAG: 2-phosphosulfolactate phosphatase [Gammaproteobacteria bacterium]|nr:2-phosphosulfolactate phosphatase [Gammaproteobacteria bacterium]